jgi:hypothetical protein
MLQTRPQIPDRWMKTCPHSSQGGYNSTTILTEITTIVSKQIFTSDFLVISLKKIFQERF